jgi:hypothetical protein
MKTCKICGRSSDDDNCCGVVVNEGMDNEYFVCEDCVPDECNNGHIISCENCGSYFTPDRLHDEHIGGFTFTECPACGKDIVECVSREEFEEEHFLSKYSVIVRMGNYSRGYVISAQNPADMMKKLMRRAELCSAAEISYSEILMDEDVIK